jgi:hypothetical protein
MKNECSAAHINEYVNSEQMMQYHRSQRAGEKRKRKMNVRQLYLK